MRLSTLLLSATGTLMAVSAPLPVIAQPVARPVIQNRPTTVPPQRIVPTRCRIRPNGEFPEAVAVAPFAMPAGTVTQVTLTGSGGSSQSTLATSAPVARGADYVAAVSVGDARTCSAVVFR